MWLFIASEGMFFASLFAAYVLLRTGSPNWPDTAGIINRAPVPAMTLLLLVGSGLSSFGSRGSESVRLLAGAVLATTFMGFKLYEYNDKIAAGLGPSSNLLLACWFTLTAVHAAHVLGGGIANLWVAAGPNDERRHALRVYWCFVDAVWLVIIATFYLV